MVGRCLNLGGFGVLVMSMGVDAGVDWEGE
jgi:hypothetical protein